MQKLSHFTRALIALAALALPGAAAVAQDAEALFAEAMVDANNKDDWDAPGRAVEKFGQACNAGLVKACYNAGILSRSGIEENSVAKWLGIGCKNDDTDACYVLALYTRDGSGVTKNDVAARAQLGKLCAAKLPWACMSYGEMQADGNGGAEDKTGAYKTYLAACEGGAGGGCFQAGLLITYGGLNPDGSVKSEDADTDESAFDELTETEVAAPPDPGFILFEKGCALGNRSACYEVATAKLSGGITAKDMAAAAIMFRRLCLEGDTAACGKMMESLKP